MEQNIVVISFTEDSKAYQALSVLRNAAVAEQVELQAAYVVERDGSGRLNVREGDSDLAALPNAATGGLIGTLVGILGGPLGVLLGGATGALVGASTDLDRGVREESVLGQISQLIPAGTTALVATVGEATEEVIDTEMARLGAVLARYPVSEVEAEIAANEEAMRSAEREAKRVLRQQHSQQRRDERDAWWAEFSPKARKFLIGDPDAR